MKTIAELAAMRMKLGSGEGFMSAGITPATVIELLDQAIKDQEAVRDLIEFMGFMARRGSSWGPQIEKKINAYLFDGASEETINAAKALLSKHRNVTVDDLLKQLESKTKKAINPGDAVMTITRRR